MTTTTNTTKFQTGSTYEHGWINDADSSTQWVIVRRTASTVWARQPNSTGNGAAFRVKVNADGCEFIKPFGSYSMSPTLRAENEVTR